MMSGSAGLDVPKHLALVRARAGLLAAVTLVAAGLALVVSFGQSERFRATAVLLQRSAEEQQPEFLCLPLVELLRLSRGNEVVF